MSLDDFNFKGQYDSESDSLLKEFYIPALSESVLYKRIAGYFSSNSLAIAARGISDFVSNGGSIQLIANVVLSEDDQDTIKRAILQKEQEILFELETMDDALKKGHLRLLAWLLKNERLEIKIAKMNNGLEHQKIGIFEDANENIVLFNGSDNETINGWLHNHESFHVFCSWIDDFTRHLEPDIISFQKLWDNERDRVTVYDVSDAFKEGLIKSAPSNDAEFETLSNEMYHKLREEYSKESDENIASSSSKKLYPFQSNAIEEFKSNNYRHFYEMATGTGKTFTSVHALKELVENVLNSFTVILVPLIDLQEQWIVELENAGFSDIQIIGGPRSPSDWEYIFNQNLLDYIEGEVSNIIYVAVYDSFFSKLAAKMKNIDNLFIIVDEAHNLSTNQLQKMPSNATYRLGLSATPEKHDEIESMSILNYFLSEDQTPFKYTIEDAINAGFLSRYYYYPIFTFLEDDEFSRYTDYSKRIAVLQNLEPIDKEALKIALRERSLIIKKAEHKTIKLKEMISSNDYDFSNSVVYCGQGKYGDTDQSLIDVVTKAFGNEDYIVSTYTSNTENRHIVLEKFKQGFYDVLVAIKCFDEGIDVPQLDKIYIMSSDRLLRQTVQRRGRVLRVCKETGKQFAHIYDMIVLPSQNYGDLNSAHTLIQNEMYRVNEYNRLAENCSENSVNVSKFIKDNYSLDLSLDTISENEMEDLIHEYC
ncbi:DEAD/DEAH box helicase family protein [Methanolobus bombayensis]|uniref:DEAD/DEAH box helicase family protein n=1 Tax=Methanolobus bombayensis TaxID=38023 RepID=UPI001AE64A4C|nr:DEAD/DEAH box helicase family protein [Methanolobus bombayensis]MBP1910470.1 superfamily II DNA or RNA helicase [Methanolobus bombayensis]